jgi:hypothetical protein
MFLKTSLPHLSHLLWFFSIVTHTSHIERVRSFCKRFTLNNERLRVWLMFHLRFFDSKVFGVRFV